VPSREPGAPAERPPPRGRSPGPSGGPRHGRAGGGEAMCRSHGITALEKALVIVSQGWRPGHNGRNKQAVFCGSHFCEATYMIRF